MTHAWENRTYLMQWASKHVDLGLASWDLKTQWLSFLKGRHQIKASLAKSRQVTLTLLAILILPQNLYSNSCPRPCLQHRPGGECWKVMEHGPIFALLLNQRERSQTPHLAHLTAIPGQEYRPVIQSVIIAGIPRCFRGSQSASQLRVKI